MEKIPIRKLDVVAQNAGIETNFAKNFTIRKIEVLLAGKDMVQALHRHTYFWVLVLEKGIGEHIIDFTPYSITDYSVFFMRPGQVHQLSLEKESSGYLMEFTTDFYEARENSTKQLLRKVSTKNYCKITKDIFTKLYTVLTYIFQEFTHQEEKYSEVIKANLEIFFIELLRQSKNPKSLSTDTNQYSQEKFETFLALLETDISTTKQVVEYANKLHITPYQLNSITKEKVGKTSSELINSYIILEAKRYLLATSNQINQIAEQLGYEDISYFIRFFKKHTGFSPETFRHKFK